MTIRLLNTSWDLVLSNWDYVNFVNYGYFTEMRGEDRSFTERVDDRSELISKVIKNVLELVSQ